jgi:transcriptional regulator with XRE-family HTH domain
MLKRFREARSLTLRDLGSAASISFAYLSLVEGAKRGVGPAMATKLADGLHLMGDERNDFLALALKTLTPHGRNRVATGCPPLLAQRFAENLAFVLRMDLARLDSFGCIQLPPPSPFPEAGVPAPRLYFVCERGGKVAPIKPAVWEHIKSHKAFPLLLIVFLRNGKQVVVQCGARPF